MFLQTNRLYLRNLRTEDTAVIHTYRNNPECARYQRWEDTALTSVAQFIEKFGCCDFLSNQSEQHYAICLNCGTFVGDLSYFYTEADNCVTLGITIAPEYQRQGIAREILGAVVKAIQQTHPRLEIVALIDPENEASIRLFERLAFTGNAMHSLSSPAFMLLTDRNKLLKNMSHATFFLAMRLPAVI